METIYQYNIRVQEGTKIVVFGCFEVARDFAMRLIGQDIYFDYFSFFSDKDYSLPYLMNKKVLGVKQLNELDDYIIVASWKEMEYAYSVLKKYGLEQRLCNIEKMRSRLMDASNLIVYGTGGWADSMFQDIGGLLSIKCFCDSNTKRTGILFHGKPVIHITELIKEPKDTCVIIASSYYNEIESKLLQHGINKDQLFYVEYDLTVFFDAGLKLTYNQQALTDIIRYCKNKKVMLYGENTIVDCMSKIFRKFFHIEADKIQREGFKEDGTIYSLAYRDMDNAICVILDKFSEKVQEALDNLALKSLQYVWLEDYNSFSRNNQKQEHECVLDSSLGYSFTKIHKEEQYSGFVKHEYIVGEKKPIVIITLGGSTTTDYGVRERSWSECLSEILTIKGIEHIIYNGACPGYKASQELVKLIRDGIWIKPDIVLTYSGTNDMWVSDAEDVKTPFVHFYQKQFYDHVVNYANPSLPWKERVMKNVYYGLQADYDLFEFWYTQMRMMHAICDDLGIAYKAFLQPVLYNKANIKESDRDIAILQGFLCEGNSLKAVETSEITKIYQKNALHFRQSASKVDESWFHDLSGLFDEYDGIYMDSCHVYERGNKILAQNIYEIIQKEIMSSKN